MAEYVEKDSVIDVLAVSHAHHANTCREASLLDRDIRLIREHPAADVAPVVHGRWLSLTECANAGVYCSVCNKKVYKEDYAWSNKRIKMRSNYCPNCGARMDGE